MSAPRAVARDSANPQREAEVRARYECRDVRGQMLYLNQCRPRESVDVVVVNEDLEAPELMFRTV